MIQLGSVSFLNRPGPGPCIVFLHGIGSNSASWLGQFEAFCAERRVIAWNAPGYGETAHLPVAAPVACDYGQALWRLLDHLGVGRCILVGQSLGQASPEDAHRWGWDAVRLAWLCLALLALPMAWAPAISAPATCWSCRRAGPANG